MVTIKVQDVAGYDEINSAVTSADTSLRDVIDLLSPGLRGVFIVDSRGLFSGVITIAVLIKWASLRLGVASEHISIRDIYKLLSATKAGDLAVGDHTTVGVHPTDTIGKVLQQMTSYHVSAIPVLDAQGKITGDLTILQVLAKVLETGGR